MTVPAFRPCWPKSRQEKWPSVAPRVAVAIAKDLSRLGRNSALTGLYTNFTFPQNGVRFIAINDNYDTIDPNRVDNDFAGIKNWFNDNLA